MPLNRRRFLTSLSLATASAPLAFAARAQNGSDLVPDADFDQTAALQTAIDSGANRLTLPSGRFLTRALEIPSGFVLSGVPGGTTLVHTGDGPILRLDAINGALVSGLTVDGNGAGGETWHGGLIHIVNASGITLRDCRVQNTRLHGIAAHNSTATIENCAVSESAYTGIFSYDSAGMTIRGNRVAACGNGGIRVWRGESGHDGAIVTGNHIRNIDWTAGGNGQNGNGINVFQADGVIVSDNHISDCGFSAVRLNATNNTQIRGNTCLNSGEVAIFSEFGFSGSVIANNIVDGAAAGISMTNFNDGGRLASCTGNIVRNLFDRSDVNPDLVRPYGIAAEADAVVTGNVVENFSGVGILAGWGPYLRDVSITGNLVRDVDTGILVSVAPEAGAAIVTNNTISGARQAALAASRWDEMASADLAADAGTFPLLTVSGNAVR